MPEQSAREMAGDALKNRPSRSASMEPTSPAEELRGWMHEMIDLRHDLHAHPELGGREVRTAALVASRLRTWGLEVTEGVGGTGVVGTLRGRERSSRSLGIRADMDALPITEQTGLPYASQTAGVMHACGHDGHTTVLLGAARHLAAHRDFAGTVHFIFQPAEEALGGAKAMIADRLFDRFPCDAIYGLHAAPGAPVGVIATAAGPLMAAFGRFDVQFSGAGGHGGLAVDRTVDLSVVQASYILALQTVVARNVPAGEPAVLSVGYVRGGAPEAFNVLPPELAVGGSVRCFSKEMQDLLARRIDELARATAAGYGCDVRVATTWHNPAVVNPKDQVEIVAGAARSALGPERVVTSVKPVGAGEDFSFMLEARPGAFVFLGNGTAPDGAFHNIHTSRFDFNDEALPAGIAYWASLVRQELKPAGPG